MNRLRNMLTGASFAHRLGRGLSAQAYCKGVTIFTQLVSVPILLSAWGTELFGLWLLLATVPTYLNLMEFGFTAAAGHDMTMRVARDDWDGARRSLHSVFTLFMLVFGTLCLTGVGVVYLVYVSGGFTIETVSADEAALALSALILSVFVSQFMSLSGGVGGSTRRLPQVLVWTGSIQLAETVCIALAAHLGGSIAAAAISALCARSVLVGLMTISFGRQVPSLRLGWSHADLKTIRALVGPSSGAFVLNLNNALTMQAPLVIIGMLTGTSAVAVFSVSRTFARAGYQIIGSLNVILEPEYARYFATSVHKYMLLFRRNLMVALVLSLALFAFVTLLGNAVIGVYTFGKIDPSMLLLGLIAGCVCLEIIWRVYLNAVYSINQHVRIAFFMLALSVSGAGLMYVFGLVWGLIGVAAALLAFNVGVLVLSMREFSQVIGKLRI